MYVQVQCTPVYFDEKHNASMTCNSQWPLEGFTLCGFCLPWDIPPTPDIPDMEHSSQTDPT